MTCRECEAFLAGNEVSNAAEEHLRQCAGCKALFGELRENALALESLRNDQLPKFVMKAPGRRRLLPWIAAAAAVVLGTLVAPRRQPPAPVMSQDVNAPAPPLKIKMLTPDPDVVIYWLIEN